MTGHCTSRWRRYEAFRIKNVGNHIIHRHVRVHENPSHGSQNQFSIQDDRKRRIIYGFWNAATIEAFTFIFCEKKVFMTGLAQSLVELGQMYLLSYSINAATTLYCGNNVIQCVMNPLWIINSNFKSTLAEVVHCECRLSCDGLKL